MIISPGGTGSASGASEINVVISWPQPGVAFAKQSKAAAAVERLGCFAPKTFCGFIPDAWKQAHHALEGDFVVGIGDKFQEGGEILHMGLFKEAETAGDTERDAAPCELKLDFH